MKTIIMPGHPYYYNTINNRPDPEFEKEYEAASKFAKVFFFCLEEFNSGTEILTRLPPSDSPKEDIFYHGWMMNSEQYRRFYLALEAKGYRLTNPPGQHTACNYFNSWYPYIEGLTPKSIMVHNSNLRTVLDEALAFKKETKSALIIKDAVKSLKHDWNEACFIPADADPLQMAKIIGTFLFTKESYNDLKLPIVIRKFENLVHVGNYPKSNMPMSHEYRTYVYKGKVLFQVPYWNTTYPKPQLKVDKNNPPIYFGEEPDPNFIKCIINEVYSKSNSKLFTIDTALKEDGRWTCIEVGDGQVSCLPDNADKEEFFKRLLTT